MKVTINTTEPQSREIDWSKKMVLSHKLYEMVVVSTGKDKPEYFEGFRFATQTVSYFVKSDFTPCATPVTITFENEL